MTVSTSYDQSADCWGCPPLSASQVRKQKDELMVKLGVVGAKQEQMIDSQAQMDERLRQVKPQDQ